MHERLSSATVISGNRKVNIRKTYDINPSKNRDILTLLEKSLKSVVPLV